MGEHYTNAFKALGDFVEDLYSIYDNGKKKTPLCFYRRLLQEASPDSGTAINKFLSPFWEFWNKHKTSIMNDITRIPRGTIIRFHDSGRAYIDIQKFIHKANSETREAIRQHLITIGAIISPNEKVLTALAEEQDEISKHIDTSSAEGRYLNEIMNRTKDLNVGGDSPQQAVMGLMTSGIFTDMMSTLQNGNMNPKKMVKMMQGMMNKMIEDMPDSDEEDDVKVEDVE